MASVSGTISGYTAEEICLNSATKTYCSPVDADGNFKIEVANLYGFFYLVEQKLFLFPGQSLQLKWSLNSTIFEASGSLAPYFKYLQDHKTLNIIEQSKAVNQIAEDEFLDPHFKVLMEKELVYEMLLLSLKEDKQAITHILKEDDLYRYADYENFPAYRQLLSAYCLDKDVEESIKKIKQIRTENIRDDLALKLFKERNLLLNNKERIALYRQLLLIVIQADKRKELHTLAGL